MRPVKSGCVSSLLLRFSNPRLDKGDDPPIGEVVPSDVECRGEVSCSKADGKQPNRLFRMSKVCMVPSAMI